MCPISFNIYGMKLNQVYFSSGTIITHLSDKPYQEINFKCHLDSVVSGKQRKILSDFHMSPVILFHFTWLCSRLQWDWKVPIRKVIEILKKCLILFQFHCLGSL